MLEWPNLIGEVDVKRLNGRKSYAYRFVILLAASTLACSPAWAEPPSAAHTTNHVAFSLAATSTVAGVVAPAPSLERSGWDQVNDVLANHVEVGLRMTRFTLSKDSQGGYDANGEYQNGFLGSINHLEADQDYTPLPFLRVKFNSYIGAELGYERLRAITRKYTNPDDARSYC